MIISSSVIWALAFAAVMTFAVPIIVLIVLSVKHIIALKPMWFGFLAFFVSQICLRLPILTALGKQSWYQSFVKNDAVVSMLLLAFTAGLFEETARYIGARFCLKENERRYNDAVSFGLGHGFCECILIVGMTEISNLATSIWLNSGANVPGAVGTQLTAAMAKITIPLVLMAVWERASTVMFHLFETVLIFRGVREKKIGWYFTALAAHLVMDFVPYLIAGKNALLLEAIVFVIGALGLVYVIRVKPKFREMQPAAVGL